MGGMYRPGTVKSPAAPSKLKPSRLLAATHQAQYKGSVRFEFKLTLVHRVQLTQFLASLERVDLSLENPLEEEYLENTICVLQEVNTDIIVQGRNQIISNRIKSKLKSTTRFYFRKIRLLRTWLLANVVNRLLHSFKLKVFTDF